MAEARELSVANLKLPIPKAFDSFNAETILRTIAESSEQLLRVHSWRPLTNNILANIGQASDVSRVYIFEIEQQPKDDAIVSLRFEWSAPTVSAHLHNPKLQYVSRKSLGLRNWTHRLRKGELIHGNIHDFNRQERTFLHSQMIKSIAIVPIHVHDQWWGYIGFDECRWEREWSTSTLLLLKSIATMFGAAIEGEKDRQSLHENESLFRSTLEKAGSGVLHLNAKLELLLVNPKCCEILGYQEKELIGKSLDNFFHPDDRFFCSQFADEIINSALPDKCNFIEAEKRLLSNDGSIVWVHINISIVHQDNGEFGFYNIFFTDITQRICTEQALQDQKKEYQNLVNTVDDIIWSIDRNLCWSFLNPAVSNILGYKPEELIGKSYTSILAPGQSTDMDSIIRAIKAKGRARYDIEALTKNRTPVTLSCNAILTLDGNSEMNGIMGTARNITERKRAEKALRESEERFQIISRATNDVIWDWNIEQGSFWSNLGLQILFGYSENEIEPSFTWWKNHIHPADQKRVINEIDILMENKRSFWSSEFRFQYGNGEYANVLDRGYIIYNDEYRPIRMIGTLLDITEQKRNEQYLRESRERLRNLASKEQNIREEERGKLSRELHDEFAQILTALKMDLNWLKMKLPQNLELLQERTVAMQHIIDMTMERVRQIATELRPALLDDLGLSAAIEWQMNQFCERTNCEHTLHISIDNQKLNQDLQITIFRIFQEALANIGRHANASSIDVNLTEENNDLLLVIKDNGCGISEEKLHDANSIGLIGMRERAGAFGGRVNICTYPESGTSIVLRIPLNNWNTLSQVKARTRKPAVQER